MIQIVPSILTDDPRELRELIARCEGVVDRISIDIIDGKFADNKTIMPEALVDIETNLAIDYQLMVVEPIEWVERCVRGQADRIIGHIEQMTSQVDFVGKVQRVGRGIGLALDLGTHVSHLDSTILNDVDVVLVMSVSAGFGGQKFDEKVIDKIKELDEIRSRDDTPFKIHDDGGVTFDKIDDTRLAGVDEVSIGRRIFDGDVGENVKKFTQAAYK